MTVLEAIARAAASAPPPTRAVDTSQPHVAITGECPLQGSINKLRNWGNEIFYHSTPAGSPPSLSSGSGLSAILHPGKLFGLAAALGLASLASSYTVTYTVSYDTFYDHGQNSLSNVACSNGEYGLVTVGYTTLDSLPTFPYIGGAPQISSWNSRYCGTCWELTYTNSEGVSTSLNITAIDTGDRSLEGFNVSLEGMDLLTGGQARSLGRVPITAARIAKSGCGL